MPGAQITIKVGEDIELNDFEKGAQEQQINDQVGRYKKIGVYTKKFAGHVLDTWECKAYRGSRGYPLFYHYLIWFLPVIFFSALTPLLLHHVVVVPVKHFQTFSVTSCNITDFVVYYEGDGEYQYNISVTYIDFDGVTHNGQISRLAYQEDDYVDLDYRKYYKNIYNSGHRTFDCYFHGDLIVATEKFILDYAQRQGWTTLAGLEVIWLTCAFFTILFTMTACCRPVAKRMITKEKFEEKNDPQFKVVDWGFVEPTVRQPLHAILYSICIEEDNLEEQTAPGATYKVVHFTSYRRDMKICQKWTVGVIGVPFLVAGIVMLIYAWLKVFVSEVVALWICGIVSFAIGQFLLLALVCKFFSVDFATRATVFCNKNNTQETFTFDGVMFIRNNDGDLFKGKLIKVATEQDAPEGNGQV